MIFIKLKEFKFLKFLIKMRFDQQKKKDKSRFYFKGFK
jgi:hypothetical protein